MADVGVNFWKNWSISSSAAAELPPTVDGSSAAGTDRVADSPLNLRKSLPPSHYQELLKWGQVSKQ
jgi:hypothetical protein